MASMSSSPAERKAAIGRKITADLDAAEVAYQARCARVAESNARASVRSKAPTLCASCRGKDMTPTLGAECGFCTNGKPLDTQADWDKSWGRIL